MYECILYRNARVDILWLSVSIFQNVFLMTATESINYSLPYLLEGLHPLACAKIILKKTNPNKLGYQNFFSICQVSQFPCFFICNRKSGGYFRRYFIFVPGSGKRAGAKRRSESSWPPGATVDLCWFGSMVPVLFFSFVSKHLFPYFIFGGAGQRGPVSLHWESISTFYEMVFRIWFARNEWLSSTSSTKHSRYKWDMHLVSSVSYISRIFVNNCILFLVPLYNTLCPPPILSPFLLFAGLGYLCCLGVVWPAHADHCSITVRKLNWTRSDGRGELLPAWGTASLSWNLLSALRWICWGNVLKLSSASQPLVLLMVDWKCIAVLVQRQAGLGTNSLLA